MSEAQNPMTPKSYKRARARAKLVKESEWMRVYELGPKHLQYESKFLNNEVQVSADSFAARWPKMSLSQRLDFVFAYHAKSDFTGEDERIVDMIMQDGDEHIWSNLALFMIRCQDRSRVLAFLRARLEAKPENPFNYIQALGEAIDLDAVPIIRSYFDQFRATAETDRLGGLSLDAWDSPGRRFLICCEALWKITVSDEYANEIRTYLQHPNPRIRTMAAQALAAQNP
jgi:hypothetical protein